MGNSRVPVSPHRLATHTSGGSGAIDAGAPCSALCGAPGKPTVAPIGLYLSRVPKQASDGDLLVRTLPNGGGPLLTDLPGHIVGS